MTASDEPAEADLAFAAELLGREAAAALARELAEADAALACQFRGEAFRQLVEARRQAAILRGEVSA